MTHLTHKHRDASAGKLSDCPGILIQIAAGETLIRTVKEGEMAFLCHNVGDCVPLASRRIHPCGVMGTSVENHDRPVGGVTKRDEEATKVQSVRNGVVIRVGFHSEPHSLENCMVVYCDPRRRRDNENPFYLTGNGHEPLTPRRVTDVHLPVPIKVIIPVGKESPEVVRACARDGLHGGNSILDEGGRIFPEQEYRSRPRKLRMARHRKVFIIVKWVIH